MIPAKYENIILINQEIVVCVWKLKFLITFVKCKLYKCSKSVLLQTDQQKPFRGPASTWKVTAIIEAAHSNN